MKKSITLQELKKNSAERLRKSARLYAKRRPLEEVKCETSTEEHFQPGTKMPTERETQESVEVAHPKKSLKQQFLEKWRKNKENKENIEKTIENSGDDLFSSRFVKKSPEIVAQNTTGSDITEESFDILEEDRDEYRSSSHDIENDCEATSSINTISIDTSTKGIPNPELQIQTDCEATSSNNNKISIDTSTKGIPNPALKRLNWSFLNNSTPVAKKPCTINSHYNAEVLASKIIWDPVTQKKLPDDQIEINTKTHFRSLKPIDVGGIADLVESTNDVVAQSIIRTLCTVVLELNKVIDRLHASKKYDAEPVMPERTYQSLSFCHSSIVSEVVVTMPSELDIDLKSLIRPSDCHELLGTDLDQILNQLSLIASRNLAEIDDCFFMYSTGRSRTKCDYCPLPDNFFENLAVVFCEGLDLNRYFKERDIDNQRTRIFSISREVFRNKIASVRDAKGKEYGADNVKQLAAELRIKFWGK